MRQCPAKPMRECSAAKTYCSRPDDPGGSQSRAAGSYSDRLGKEAVMNLRAIRMLFVAALAALPAGLAAAQEAEVPGQSWPRTLTVGTASPGGTYYNYGEGLAQIL